MFLLSGCNKMRWFILMAMLMMKDEQVSEKSDKTHVLN